MARAEQTLPEELFLGMDRSSPMPLYYQVASSLERAITDGTLPPGSRLENEISLGERLGLSRPTIRRAIQELVDKGLLVRRRGVGTQVVQGRVTRNVEFTSLYEDLEQSGQSPQTQLLSTEIRVADQSISEILGVEVGSQTLFIRRLRLADGVPLALLENTLPEPYADIDAGRLSRHGLYQILRSKGVNMRVARQAISARQATSEEARLLDMPGRSAVLTMNRTAFDNSGRAVEYGRHCYRPDLYSFEATLVNR